MKQITTELLTELRDTKVIRVSGSYAKGEQGENSDIDFWVKEERPDSKVRNITKVISVLEKHGIKCGSHFVDYIHTINTDIQLEFALYFPRYKNGEVNIMGVVFKT